MAVKRLMTAQIEKVGVSEMPEGRFRVENNRGVMYFEPDQLQQLAECVADILVQIEEREACEGEHPIQTAARVASKSQASRPHPFDKCSMVIEVEGGVAGLMKRGGPRVEDRWRFVAVTKRAPTLDDLGSWQASLSGKLAGGYGCTIDYQILDSDSDLWRTYWFCAGSAE